MNNKNRQFIHNTKKERIIIYSNNIRFQYKMDDFEFHRNFKFDFS